MPAFQLEILTPEKTVYSAAVERLRAPGSEGSFGVLARHQPMVAALAVGRLSFVEEGGGLLLAALGGGFAEVRPERVTVLAESAELAGAIDVARARAARARALERLGQQEPIDQARARAALSRALNRLRVAGAD